MNSQIGIDDWFAFAWRYWPDIFFLVVLIGITILSGFVGKDGRLLKMAIIVFLVSIVICGLHVTFTAKKNITLALLGAEDDRVAETAYQDFSRRVSLEESVKLLSNKHENQNVRFYAACLTSEILATNDKQTVATVLKKVQDAPNIKPQFFGTNSVNKKFTYLEFPIPVRVLIEQQLEDIRKRQP